MHAAQLQQAHFSRFTHRAAASLRACGFGAPSADEARVIVFDSAPWWPLREDAANLLCYHEAMRAARFRHALDRDTYTIAHAFWRVALGVALNIDPARVALSRAPDGQPQLPGTGLATSLSHSGTLVAVAIAKGQTVGVDIEGYPPRGNLHEIADVLCSATESAGMEALGGDARTRALLELWTRKEALLKAFGVGLRVAPCTVEAPLHAAFAPPASATVTCACRIATLAMPMGWLGALALAHDIPAHTLHHV